MIRWLLISLLSLAFLPGISQELLIQGDFDDFAADPLGNLYTVKENTLIKYSPSGVRQYEYTSLEYGSISSVDVSNPMKLLIYFREFDRAVFLDKYLSPSSDIVDVSAHGIITSAALATAYDNGIWIFDSGSDRLLRLDGSLNVSHQSDPINASQDYGNLKRLKEAGQSVLLAFEHKVLVFDQYASYDKSIPVDSAQTISFMNNALVYITQNQLLRYNYITHEVKKMPWPFGTVHSIRLSNKQTFYLNDKGVYKTDIFR